MRYTKQHKSITRRRIIASAARLFAARGYAATSIEEIMRACDLTRGGFYAHFASKGQLYDEAIQQAAPGNAVSRSQSADAFGQIDALLDEYLTASRSETRFAFLCADASSETPTVRKAYASALKSLVDEINRACAEQLSPLADDAALSITAVIVGALTIVHSTDDAELRARVLRSCRANARMLLAAEREEHRSCFWLPLPIAERRALMASSPRE